jgi:hypothetical protein
MIYHRFESSIQQIVPEMTLKPFRHLLPFIPENYRDKFLDFLKSGLDMTSSFISITAAAKIRHKPVTDFIHQRMQDNMSEILD